MEELIRTLSGELGQKEEYVANVVRLLDEGNTIPFIARYRKELHGAMDDQMLRTLETRLQYLRGLQERRETVLAAIGEQGKLTEDRRPSNGWLPWCGSTASSISPLETAPPAGRRNRPRRS